MLLSNSSNPERPFRYEPPAWARVWEEDHSAVGAGVEGDSSALIYALEFDDPAADEAEDRDRHRIDQACLATAIGGFVMVAVQLLRWWLA